MKVISAKAAIASVLLAAAAMLESYWTPFVLGAL